MRKQQKKEIKNEKLLLISHRGYGKKAFLRYHSNGTLQSVSNQLTGFEIGIEKGANTLEIDLNKTKDNEIITAHGIPFFQSLFKTKVEYLKKYPESMTLFDLVTWLYKQNTNIKLYLELKSTKIKLSDIKQTITLVAKNVEGKIKATEIEETLYERIMLYTGNQHQINLLLAEKSKADLRTEQLKILTVHNFILTKKKLGEYGNLGKENCRLWGVEQGGLIVGNPVVIKLMNTKFPMFPPLRKIRHYLLNIADLVDYAHSLGLKYIFGTIDDPIWINRLVEQDIDGIVPNDPEYFTGKDLRT